MNLQVPQNAGDFHTSWATVSVSRRPVLSEVPHSTRVRSWPIYGRHRRVVRAVGGLTNQVGIQECRSARPTCGAGLRVCPAQQRVYCLQARIWQAIQRGYGIHCTLWPVCTGVMAVKRSTSLHGTYSNHRTLSSGGSNSFMTTICVRSTLRTQFTYHLNQQGRNVGILVSME
jgi:hypothetical protein